MNLLVALDFRNTSFIDHYKFQIYADCDVEHGLEAQRNVLRRYRYELSKLSLSRYSNVVERNQTFEILSTSVTELLEHKSDVNGGVGIGTPLKAVAQLGGYRLKTSFSVDVLAYLTKLYVDCGYLQTAAKTDLFNFLAARVETSNSGDAALSAGSIKNKYNQVVTSTATKTRAMLTKMIGQIDLEFK
ncbi:MAG: hypothetical protein EOO88_39490 [Pedobacter sp.]|nr:MAG: hypothetical protein EOO88_39490 [Pedobacter sp.]